MAKEVKSWRAEDGTLHPDERTAVERDLRCAVGKLFPSPIPDDKFDQMVDSVLKAREPLVRALTDYDRVFPQARATPASAPPSGS